MSRRSAHNKARKKAYRKHYGHRRDEESKNEEYTKAWRWGWKRKRDGKG